MNLLFIVLSIFSISTLISFYYFEDIINVMMICILIIAMYLAFKVSACYQNKMKFALSYVFLGAMFASYSASEIIYFLQGVIGSQQFLSFEDIGYGLFYVFGILFVLKQIQFFTIMPNRKESLICIGVGLGLFLIYLCYAINYVEVVDFYVTSISMSLACVFFSITLLALFVLKSSNRFKEWLLVSVAIGIYTLSDLHYYVTESLGSFSYSDISNYGWFIAPVVFIYILVKLNKNPRESV